MRLPLNVAALGAVASAAWGAVAWLSAAWGAVASVLLASASVVPVMGFAQRAVVVSVTEFAPRALVVVVASGVQECALVDGAEDGAIRSQLVSDWGTMVVIRVTM